MPVQPSYRAEAFTCPICDVHAHMAWANLYDQQTGHDTQFVSATCSHCRTRNLWRFDYQTYVGTLIFPDKTIVALPEPDMPDDIRRDYEEAATIFNRSPRGSAALLRLCLQKLCVFLGQPGEHIDKDIRALAKLNVLPPLVIKVADTVRITGNQAVHPGEMSEEDVDHVAAKMFDLVNFIVRKGISEPKELEALYNMVPEGPRKAAEEKDAKARVQSKE